eukprot:4646809-Prymnesium_polylepis.1
MWCAADGHPRSCNATRGWVGCRVWQLSRWGTRAHPVKHNVRLGTLDLSDELVVPPEHQRAQVAPQHAPQLRLSRLELVAHGAAEPLDTTVGAATHAIVRAVVDREQRGDEGIEARTEARDVENDGRCRREQRARVQVDRLIGEPQHALQQRVGRARELVEQQVMRRAEERRHRRGHVDGLHSGRVERQVAARLKEHGVEQRLQLAALQRVDAVVGGEERDDERHAQVRHREVREQQLGIVLTECARRVPAVRGVLAVALGREVGQIPHVQQVILGLHD